MRLVDGELMMYAAGKAYEAKTGECIPLDGFGSPLKPASTPWSLDDLEWFYPNLYKRFPA